MLRQGIGRVKPVKNLAPIKGMLVVLVLANCVLNGGGAFAATHPGQLCDRAASRAAAATGVPVDILLAISRVETGRPLDGTRSPWPWTINADGAGTFYDSKSDAVSAAEAHLGDGTGTFDIGCFQLNIRWHGSGFRTFEEMFDPEKNADYAARFLMTLYAQSGNWADAVAAYHSRTPELGQAYLSQVRAVLDEPQGDAPPTAAPQPRENAFPLLKTGERGSLGSLVPVMVAASPLIGGGN